MLVLIQDSNVDVREFKSTGLHVMHAKTMTVDGEQAFIIGSPFKQDYWDTTQHLIKDSRREPAHVRTVHDVSVKLEGGSVYHVEIFFTDIWNYISGKNTSKISVKLFGGNIWDLIII